MTAAPAVETVLRPTAAAALRNAVTGLLLALLVSWMFAAWWTAPRAADEARLDSDLAAGSIDLYQRADGIERARGIFGALQPSLDRQGDLVVWRTTSGQTFYAGPAADAQLGDVFAFDDSARSRAEAAERRLQAAGVPRIYDAGPVPLLGVMLLGSGLVVLVAGPPPTRGTRWFWFWVGGAPGGLGVLAWLALERIWPRPAALAAQREPVHGYAGLAWMLLAAFVWSVLAVELRDAFGPGLVPG